METETTLRIRGDPQVIFKLAADVPDWPRILPHYRWVRVVHEGRGERLVEMAARRDAIPVRWIAQQRLFPAERRITFRHVGGITRGMDVVWSLTPEPDGRVLVRLLHRFSPRWPLVPDWLVYQLIGRFFVDSIAHKTLRRIAELAEEQSAARASMPGSR